MIVIKKCFLKNLLYLLSNVPLQKNVFDLKRLSLCFIFGEPHLKSEVILNRAENNESRLGSLNYLHINV